MANTQNLAIIDFIGLCNKTNQDLSTITKFLDLLAEDAINFNEFSTGKSLYKYYLFLQDCCE